MFAAKVALGINSAKTHPAAFAQKVQISENLRRIAKSDLTSCYWVKRFPRRTSTSQVCLFERGTLGCQSLLDNLILAQSYSRRRKILPKCNSPSICELIRLPNQRGSCIMTGTHKSLQSTDSPNALQLLLRQINATSESQLVLLTARNSGACSSRPGLRA